MSKETQEIAEALWFFDNGSIKERKALRHKETVSYGNFSYSRDKWVYLVWKSTEINSQYKGEPLVKVVPRLYLDKEVIAKIVEAQPWSYL